MAVRQRQKRVDEVNSTRSHVTAPIAEAIALGTAAGGLVIGAMQAQADDRIVTEASLRTGALPEPGVDHLASNIAHGQGENAAAPDAGAIVTHETTVSNAPMTASDHVSPAPEILQPSPADIAAAPLVPAPAPPNGDAPLPVNDFAHELAGQITASLTKAIEETGPAMSPVDLGQSIVNSIIEASQHVVAALDLGSATAPAQSIVAEINPQGIVLEVVDQTSHIAGTVTAEVADIAVSVLAEVANLPGEILGGIATTEDVSSLASVPSFLLGNDGSDSPGGMLSDVFYSDGAEQSLSIPDLSLAASSILSTAGSDVLGFLGVSYIDAPMDHHGQALSLNALSIL